MRYFLCDIGKAFLRFTLTDLDYKDAIYRFRTGLSGSSFFVNNISFSAEGILASQNVTVIAFIQKFMPFANYVLYNIQVTELLVAAGWLSEPQGEYKPLCMHIVLESDSYVRKLPNFNFLDHTLTSVLREHEKVWEVIGFFGTRTGQVKGLKGIFNF